MGVIILIVICCIRVLCYKGKCCWRPMKVNTSQDPYGFNNLVVAVASFSCKDSADRRDTGKRSSVTFLVFWVYFMHQARSWPTHITWLSTMHLTLCLLGMWQKTHRCVPLRRGPWQCWYYVGPTPKDKGRHLFPSLLCPAHPGPDNLPHQYGVGLRRGRGTVSLATPHSHSPDM